jgi:hypothetical protein
MTAMKPERKKLGLAYPTMPEDELAKLAEAKRPLETGSAGQPTGKK